MLKIILSRLKTQAEKFIAEEQAGFRAGRSTTEQTFNLRVILCEKHLRRQQDLHNVFIDFKKAFDMVWHAALWATMKKYNNSANLIRVFKNLYDKATSAVVFNGWRLVPNNGWSPTGISTLTHPLQHTSGKDHDTRIRRPRSHCQHWNQNNHQSLLCFLAGEEEELEKKKKVARLDKASTAFGMEISADKTKLMTESTSGINTEIKVNGQKLETVTSFNAQSVGTSEKERTLNIL